MPGENFSIVPGLALAQASRPGNIRKRQGATMHGIESLFVLWRLGTRISWTLRLAGVAKKNVRQRYLSPILLAVRAKSGEAGLLEIASKCTSDKKCHFKGSPVNRMPAACTL